CQIRLDGLGHRLHVRIGIENAVSVSQRLLPSQRRLVLSIKPPWYRLPPRNGAWTMSEDLAVGSAAAVTARPPGRVSAAARSFVGLAHSLFAAYWADDLMGLAGEMAYNYLFALFPFFVFLAALLGFVGGHVGHEDLFSQVML